LTLVRKKRFHFFDHEPLIRKLFFNCRAVAPRGRKESLVAGVRLGREQFIGRDDLRVVRIAPDHMVLRSARRQTLPRGHSRLLRHLLSRSKSHELTSVSGIRPGRKQLTGRDDLRVVRIAPDHMVLRPARRQTLPGGPLHVASPSAKSKQKTTN